MREIMTTAHYWICGLTLLMLAAMLFVELMKEAAENWKKGKNKGARIAFMIAVVVATAYGGTKKAGTITYPYTDPEQKYLEDAGSYVSNDTVRVAFTRIIAPTNAPLLIDRRRLDQTNDVDWVNFTNTTFAAFNQPQILQVPAATNWNWIVYTTWTPGPRVQTNGVWHAYWGKDGKAEAYFIPVRTCVRVDSEVIATPKSKWDATNNTEEVEQ